MIITFYTCTMVKINYLYVLVKLVVPEVKLSTFEVLQQFKISKKFATLIFCNNLISPKKFATFCFATFWFFSKTLQHFFATKLLQKFAFCNNYNCCKERGHFCKKKTYGALPMGSTLRSFQFISLWWTKTWILKLLT